VTLDTKRATTLARHGANVRKATELRDQAICEAVAAGGSLREVAEAVGLSHMGVSQIVRRAKEA
jgi:DNA-directed RNA polymerase specialized sigma subunit